MSLLSRVQNEKRRNSLLNLYETLETSLGPSHWWPADTPFEVCIGAILTQNAPWTGVTKAIRNLRDIGAFTAESIAGTDDRVLAEAVRPTVYYNQKAKRLKVFCRFLLEEFGGKVEAMRDLEPRDARRRLLEIRGIGYETADSILLYALGMPVFVVDAYTKRILIRHGLMDEECGYEYLKEYFEDVIEPDAALYNEFHALLCRVGAEFCKRKPICDRCPVRGAWGEPAL